MTRKKQEEDKKINYSRQPKNFVVTFSSTRDRTDAYWLMVHPHTGELPPADPRVLTLCAIVKESNHKWVLSDKPAHLVQNVNFQCRSSITRSELAENVCKEFFDALPDLKEMYTKTSDPQTFEEEIHELEEPVEENLPVAVEENPPDRLKLSVMFGAHELATIVLNLGTTQILPCSFKRLTETDPQVEESVENVSSKPSFLSQIKNVTQTEHNSVSCFLIQPDSERKKFLDRAESELCGFRTHIKSGKKMGQENSRFMQSLRRTLEWCLKHHKVCVEEGESLATISESGREFCFEKVNEILESARFSKDDPRAYVTSGSLKLSAEFVAYMILLTDPYIDRVLDKCGIHMGNIPATDPSTGITKEYVRRAKIWKTLRRVFGMKVADRFRVGPSSSYMKMNELESILEKKIQSMSLQKVYEYLVDVRSLSTVFKFSQVHVIRCEKRADE